METPEIEPLPAKGSIQLLGEPDTLAIIVGGSESAFPPHIPTPPPIPFPVPRPHSLPFPEPFPKPNPMPPGIYQ